MNISIYLKKSCYLFAILAFSFLFSYSERKADNVYAAGEADAIAVRVLPNPKHYSPMRWYIEQGFTGSPELLTVDGYEAIRDGRTVYINAANIDFSSNILYTNIYVISYNQDADAGTIMVLNQIMDHWKFNTNLPSEEKVKVIRDVKRLAQSQEIKKLVDDYKKKNGYFPVLSSGSYIPNTTISTWPSWDANLAKLIGASLPVDPVNKLSSCSGFDEKSCWNDVSKIFAFASELSQNRLPAGSFVSFYKTDPKGSGYTYCSFSETGLNISGDGFCKSVGCVPLQSPDLNCGDNGCGGVYGACGPNESCYKHKCYANCSTGPGCKGSLENAYQVGGYCANNLKCFKCSVGYQWDGSTCKVVTSGGADDEEPGTCYPDACNGICPPNCSAGQDPDCSATGCAGDHECDLNSECSSTYYGNGDCDQIKCCGNGVCDSGSGETNANCAQDCQGTMINNECIFPATFPCNL